MKQLIKNELIKLKAQKSYVVLSCLVLALVIVVSFFTSVVVTPLVNLINYGEDMLVESAAYDWAIETIYENPDSALAGILRTVFKDPKSDGDKMREEAESLDPNMYAYNGNYQTCLAQARFYDFRDEHGVPAWIEQIYSWELIELYRWQSLVQDLQNGTCTPTDMINDYYLESVLYASFMEPQYFISIDYDYKTDAHSYTFYRSSEDGDLECTWEEVLESLVAHLPVCQQMISQIENEMLTLEPDAYYDALILEQQMNVKQYEATIAEIEEILKTGQNLTEWEIEYHQSELANLRGRIEDAGKVSQAFAELKEKGTHPESNAFMIVRVLLPGVLEARRYAAASAQAEIPEGEFGLGVRLERSAGAHELRVLDKALIAIEHAYKNDLALEGMVSSNSKGTFLNNLSTAAFMISAVTVVLSSMILSREFATGTVRLWVIRPKTRTKLLASKMITLFMYVIGMMLICFGITYVFALVNHVLDLFFYGQSTLFMPDYGVVFGKVVAIPAVAEHLWALVVLTLPVLLYAVFCLFVSVLTKKGVLGIVLGMLLLMFATDIQAIALIVANFTGVFGYLLHATVLPYLGMDRLLDSALDYAVSGLSVGMGGMEDLLDLETLLMSQIWGASPYVFSSLVGVIVLAVHIAVLILASLFAFKRTQIKS